MALRVTRKQQRLLMGAVILVVGWLAQQSGIDVASLVERNPSTGFVATGPVDPQSSPRPPTPSASSSVDRIERAVAARESGFMVTVDARVVKTLRDDLDGSRHQRFLIELAPGRTLLVAHNIDLADRIRIEEGDSVRVRGQYEWNDRGGVLHWTHHDPDGDHPGGWIEANGRRVE